MTLAVDRAVKPQNKQTKTGFLMKWLILCGGLVWHASNNYHIYCHTCWPALAWVTLACKFPSVRPSLNIYPGCLVSATPLPVLYWSFSNFAGVFFMVWGCACGLDIIVRFWGGGSLFPIGELSHFSTSMVPCERNSSCNFLPIFLKLCTCFLHGLKMWFGYNPCVNFCHFFHFVNFVIFWPPILWKCI